MTDHRQITLGSDLLLNAEQRLPCVLLIDTSKTNTTDAMLMINNGLAKFQRELSQDRMAAKRVDVSLVTFGPIRKLVDFANIDHIHWPHLTASGECLIGEGIEFALAQVEQRKRAYRKAGVAYHRPWVFLLSNAQTDRDNWQHAVKMIADAERGTVMRNSNNRQLLGRHVIDRTWRSDYSYHGRTPG